MKTRFIQEDDLLSPDFTANQYRHSSGLLHTNIKPEVGSTPENTGYSAVIFINTPSHDDSGLAHAIEHLSFRRSKAYPQASTLFQLTSLSNAKINASTLGNVTCFHCTCPEKTVFELALSYLIEGILSPIITQEELTLEISDAGQSGVIYRELLGYQTDPDYLEHIQILRGDNSIHKIYCHGGVTDCLDQITLGTISDYHKAYYQADNIKLITMASDIDKLQTLFDVSLVNHSTGNSAGNGIKKATKINADTQGCNRKTEENNNCYQANRLSKNSQQTVYTWWLDSSYYSHIEANAIGLSALIAQAGGKMVPISNDTNALHQFAIRVICCLPYIQHIQHIQHIQQLIIEQLSSPLINSRIPERYNGKYPEQINQIIQLYTLCTQSKKPMQNESLLAQLSVEPLSSSFAPITICADSLNHKATSSAEDKLINTHKKHQHLKHESLMIKQLLAANKQTESAPDNTNTWSSFMLIELQQGINACTLAKILNTKYQLEAISLSNLLLLKDPEPPATRASLPDFAKIIIENQHCRQPNLPQVLHKLHSQLNTVQHSKNQINSGFKLITLFELKENKHTPTFNVNVTSRGHAWCAQHWIYRIPIENEELLIAWLISYILGASSHFMQPRLNGECYSIASVYCDDVKELVLYSAFDINTIQRMKNVSHSLTVIAEDIGFLSDALILAKHKLHRVYQDKYWQFSTEHLNRISQLTSGIYDQHEFECLMSKISSGTLTNFIKKRLC